MAVNALLNKPPVVVTRDTSLKEAAKIMLEENVGTVIVVKEKGSYKPCGIVTDRDIALKLADSDNAENLSIKDIVLPQLVSLRYDQSIKNLTSTMAENRIRRVVIVDNNGNAVGVVAMDDLVVMLADELGDVKKIVESQSCW